MELESVETSYARWARFYDKTFGALTNRARQRAVDHINQSSSRVLEVGVGTGMALPFYSADLQVTGIDYSEDMLQKAKGKVRDLQLGHVETLRQMDARELDFPDDHFDTVAAMHVLSVVPEPERVMSEIARVCRPGGQVVINNHFSRDKGFLAFVERNFAGLSDVLGWHSDFEIDRILQEPSLIVEQRKTLPPMGMMTFLVLRKAEAA